MIIIIIFIKIIMIHPDNIWRSHIYTHHMDARLRQDNSGKCHSRSESVPPRWGFHGKYGSGWLTQLSPRRAPQSRFDQLSNDSSPSRLPQEAHVLLSCPSAPNLKRQPTMLHLFCFHGNSSRLSWPGKAGKSARRRSSCVAGESWQRLRYGGQYWSHLDTVQSKARAS